MDPGGNADDLRRDPRFPGDAQAHCAGREKVGLELGKPEVECPLGPGQPEEWTPLPAVAGRRCGYFEAHWYRQWAEP